MKRDRHGIKNSLRLNRGTRGAVDRARIRHGRRDDVAELLQRCLDRLNQNERDLLEANRLAARREDVRRRAA